MNILSKMIWILTWGFGFSIISCGSHSPGVASQKSVVIQDPLGGSRFIFVSQVDGNIWGIRCPNAVEAYMNKTLEEVLRCGYTTAVGPVAVDNFISSMPEGLDRYSLEKDLRASIAVPVASNRDRYYDAWSILKSLAQNQPSSAVVIPCSDQNCRPSSALSVSVNVSAASATLYIYATDGAGHIGQFNVTSTHPTEIIYLNTRNKAAVNLQAGTTNIYINRALKENIIVNFAGGTAKFFYL